MVGMTAKDIRAEQMDAQIAQAMLAQSPDCIKLIDPDGHLCFMSENGLELMEIGEFDSVRGALWWDLWPESQQETLRNAVSAAGRGVTVVFEAECPTAAGTPKHWRVRVSLVKGGALDGMIVAASQDITDTVQAAAAQERLSADNAALRRFTRFVAHDLRGPIRHHKILAEMIALSEEALPETEELAREIEGSASGMLDLLSGLEALHALDKIEAAPTALKIGELADQVMQMFDKTSFDLRVTPEARTASVRADRGMMLSVLCNLIDNAAKYHDGQGRVTVTLSHESGGPKDMHQFLFCDDGPGFADDRFDDLFEPLVRQSNSANIGGSGLGLALVRRLIGLHGGMVEALRGRPDGARGAALRLRLPRVAAQ